MHRPIIPGTVEIFGGPDAGYWPNAVILHRQYRTGRLGQLVVAAKLGAWGLDDDSRRRIEVAVGVDQAQLPGQVSQGYMLEPDVERAASVIGTQIEELGPLCVTGAVIAGLVDVPAFRSRTLFCRTFGTGGCIVSQPGIAVHDAPLVEYTDHQGGDTTVPHDPGNPNFAQITLPFDSSPVTVAQIRF